MKTTLQEVLKRTTPGPWVVDECEDAYGNDTIRKADGSPNGGLEGDPIATVYDPYGADLIVHMRNTYEELVAVLTALASTARTFRNVPKEEQEWTPIDDEALDAAFDILAKVNNVEAVE
jgi:hypothetical protein